MAHENPQDPQPGNENHGGLEGLDPGELLARGLNTVKPSGGAMAWEPPSVEELGKLMPAYRIEHLIGRGGMGAVYKGVQLNLDRAVAIKLLPVELSADEQFVVRFEREARTLARLQHSRIVTIHDSGQTSEGHLYFVMEYVDGTDLRAILRGPGLNPEQALAVVEQLCDALQVAHREGVIHRDIKPENVLITRDGYVKLADFGLARLPQSALDSGLTNSNVVMGTADYMAPEQRTGAVHADARSDIFALGIMLYEMLTGQPPRGVFDPPSHRVQVDVRIDEVVLKALQSDPERRYQKASELKTDVEHIRSTPLPEISATGSALDTVPAAKSARKLLLAALVLVVVLPVLGFLGWQLGGHRKIAAEPPALPRTISTPPSSAPVTEPDSVHAQLVQMLNDPADGARKLSTGQLVRELTRDIPMVKIERKPEAGGIDWAHSRKEAPFSNSLGMQFVSLDSEHPVLMSVWLVRVQDYAAYARVNSASPCWVSFARDKSRLGGTYPVVGVDWDEAQSFCQWLTQVEVTDGWIPRGAKYRLATDEEWSRAAGLPAEKGTTPAQKNGQDQTHFPWGVQFPPPQSNLGNYADDAYHKKVPQDHWLEGYSDGYVGPSPVGTFPANDLGLYDLGGNLLCWCADWFDETHRQRVLRGASYTEGRRADLLSSHRANVDAKVRHSNIGFRCVLDLSGAAVGERVVAQSASTTPPPVGQEPVAAKPLPLPAAAPAPSVANSAVSPIATPAGWPPVAIKGGDPAKMEKLLQGYTWALHGWVLNFKRDHLLMVQEGKPPLRTWHWWSTGANTVHIQYSGEPAVFDPKVGGDLTFDSVFGKYDLRDYRNREESQIGWRLDPVGLGTPAPVPPLVPVVAAPPQPFKVLNAPGLEKAVREYTWTLDGWVLEFNDGEALLVQKQQPGPEAWHWWVTGENKIHVQRANEPRDPAPDTGAELTFNAARTQFELREVKNLSQVRVGQRAGAANIQPVIPKGLEEAVSNYLWQWTDSHDDKPATVQFQPRGMSTRGFHWKWRYRPGSTEVIVDCVWGSDQHMYVYFNASYTEFTAYGGAGARGQRGQWIGSGPAPAPVPEKSAANWQEMMLKSDWSYGDTGSFHFEPDHTGFHVVKSLTILFRWEAVGERVVKVTRLKQGSIQSRTATLNFRRDWSGYDGEGFSGKPASGSRIDPSRPAQPVTAGAGANSSPSAAPSPLPVASPAPEVMTWLATFEGQLPNAAGWSLAPLRVPATMDLRNQFLALRTGLRAEATKNGPAWQPVYDRALAVSTLLEGLWQERMTAASHFDINNKQTWFNEGPWQKRIEEARAMLFSQNEQFRAARISLGTQTPVSALSGSPALAIFPGVSNPAVPEPPKPLSKDELKFWVGGDGPSGTNFGNGPAHIGLAGTVGTNSPVPMAVNVECYWVAERKRKNSLLPIAPTNKASGTCSKDHPFHFVLDDVKSFVRDNGRTYGITSVAGEYRGWAICVRNSKGEKLAVGSNVGAADLIH